MVHWWHTPFRGERNPASERGSNATIQGRTTSNGRTRYRVIVRKEGQYATRTFRTKAARTKLGERDGGRDRAEDVQAQRSRGDKTVGNVIDRYLEQVLPTRRKKRLAETRSDT